MLDQETTAIMLENPATIIKSFLDFRSASNTIATEKSKRAYEWIKSYINLHYNEKDVFSIDTSFFERFYTTFLPRHILNIGLSEIEEIAREWICFVGYIEAHCNLKGVEELFSSVYRDQEKEINRILYLMMEIRKYSEVPVLCWDPVVVDIVGYKNFKKQEKALSKYVVYDQGYYNIHDKIGNNVILLKEKPVRTFFKIKIDASLAEDMNVGDWLHMSLKRKLFATAWNIVNIKAYYNAHATFYLNQGGFKNETNPSS